MCQALQILHFTFIYVYNHKITSSQCFNDTVQLSFCSFWEPEYDRFMQKYDVCNHVLSSYSKNTEPFVRSSKCQHFTLFTFIQNLFVAMFNNTVLLNSRNQNMTVLISNNHFLKYSFLCILTWIFVKLRFTELGNSDSQLNLTSFGQVWTNYTKLNSVSLPLFLYLSLIFLCVSLETRL